MHVGQGFGDFHWKLSHFPCHKPVLHISNLLPSRLVHFREKSLPVNPPKHLILNYLAQLKEVLLFPSCDLPHFGFFSCHSHPRHVACLIFKEQVTSI